MTWVSLVESPQDKKFYPSNDSPENETEVQLQLNDWRSASKLEAHIAVDSPKLFMVRDSLGWVMYIHEDLLKGV